MHHIYAEFREAPLKTVLKFWALPIYREGGGVREFVQSKKFYKQFSHDMLDIHNVCITHAKIYKTSPQKRGVKRGRHKQIRSSTAKPLSPATTVEFAVKRNKKRNIMSLARDFNFHFPFSLARDFNFHFPFSSRMFEAIPFCNTIFCSQQTFPCTT